MFKCENCHATVPPKTQATRVIVERRTKPHPFRREVHRFAFLTADGKRKTIYNDDPGGTGWEIAREIIVCPDCAERLEQRSDVI